MDSGFGILHPHPSRVLYLPLGFALEAVGLHHTPHLDSSLTLGGPILLHGHLGRYTSQILSIMGQVIRGDQTTLYSTPPGIYTSRYLYFSKRNLFETQRNLLLLGRQKPSRQKLPGGLAKGATA
jgi:hypothetical protein